MPTLDTAAPAPHPSAPTAEQIEVWKSFLAAHAHVTRLLEAELVAAHALSLAEYDVLVQLSEAPGGRLRMTELADRVLLSRSGLTRLVDRMSRDGLVTREPCPDDARGTFTVMSGQGRQALEGAATTHLAGVAHHVTAVLPPAELALMGQVMKRLLAPATPAAVAPAQASSD